MNLKQKKKNIKVLLLYEKFLIERFNKKNI